MAWSSTYQRRNELLKTLEIPVISEIRGQLGDHLASLIFEQCPEELKAAIGLVPLQGPGNELWISPVDALKGNLCFSPLYSRKCVAALTHQGILEIGKQIEEKYKNDMKTFYQQQIEKTENSMRELCKLEAIVLEDQLRKEEYEKYSHQLEMLTDYYEKKINEIIEAFREEMIKQTIQTDQDLKQLDRTWKEKCRKQLTKVTQEFLSKLHNQEGSLVENFQEKIKCIQEKQNQIADCLKAKYEQALKRLKHNLERKHSTDLQQYLKFEERKCEDEKFELTKRYADEIKQLKILLNGQKQRINQLIKLKNIKINEMERREQYLKEIIKQFKKFIYYALKAAPTQAEFLLDTDKLQMFTIDERCFNGNTAVINQKQTDKRVIKKEDEPDSSVHSSTHPSVVTINNNVEDKQPYSRRSIIETNDSLIAIEERFKKPADSELQINFVLTDKSLLTTKDSVLLQLKNNEQKSINLLKTLSKSRQSLSICDRKLSQTSYDGSPIVTSKLALHTDSLDIITHSTSTINIEKSHENDLKTGTIVFKTETKPLQSQTRKTTKKTKPIRKTKRNSKKTVHKPEIVGTKIDYPEEFTTERIQSFVNLLKDNDSLMKLFTSVVR